MVIKNKFIGVGVAVIAITGVLSYGLYNHRFEKVDFQNKDYSVRLNEKTNKLYVKYKGDNEFGIVNIREQNGAVNGTTYIINKGINQSIPLVYDNGEYSISLCRLNANRLIVEERSKVYLMSDDTMDKYKKDGYYIDESKYIKQLAKKLKTEDELKTAYNIYGYIVENIEYNDNLADMIKAGELKLYKPNLEEVLENKAGICLDQASLMASLLRANDVATRICTGYNEKKESHAWVEANIQGKWLAFDTSLRRDYTDSTMEEYEVAKYY